MIHQTCENVKMVHGKNNPPTSKLSDTLLGILGAITFSIASWAILTNIDTKEKTAVNATRISFVESELKGISDKLDRIFERVSK